MTLNRTARSSDIDIARGISRRLSGQAGKPQPSASLGYIRFDASRFVPQSPPQSAALFGPGMWNEMLALCAEESHAELAFVVDDQGLVIASHGSEEDSLVEGIGARLLIAFEQTDQMSALGDPAESIAIQMGKRWLTGLRMRIEGRRPVIIGVLGPEVVSQETRERLEERKLREG